MRVRPSAPAFALGLLAVPVLVAGGASAQTVCTGASAGGTSEIRCTVSNGNIDINADTVTITSGSLGRDLIHATRSGGSGNIDIDFAGTSLRRTNTGEEAAIRARITSGATAGGTITVNVRGGTIATTQESVKGVEADHSGHTGTVSLTVSGGSITTAGRLARGLLAKYSASSGNPGSGDISATLSGGSITTGGERAQGLMVQHNGAGTAGTAVTGGTITTTGQFAHGTWAVALSGTADLSITHSGGGIITQGSQAHGHEMRRYAAGGGGSHTVLMSGGSIETRGAASHGISVDLTSASTATEGISIGITGGTITARGDGVNARHAGTRGIGVTVGDGATVTGGDDGIEVRNAGTGLALAKRYAPEAVRSLPANRDLGADDPITFPDHRAQLVRVDGTVTGGLNAGVRLNGGGAVVVGRTGRVVAGSLGSAILADGPLIVRVDGRVTGRVEQTGSGALAVEGGGASGIHALHRGTAGRVSVTHGAGAVEGRTGILAEVVRASASGATRATDQPLLGVTWTDGTFTHGTGGDTGRLAAASAWRVVDLDREAAAGKTVRYGAPAGIEARVLNWGAVVTEVASGDDPGAIADNAAQMALLATSGAASRRDAILTQFRAALRNDELAVESAVLTAIDPTATGTDDISDAEIAAYLQADNAARRNLLRYILSRGLSDVEKGVLRAVATGDGAAADAALAAAGFTDDAADDTDYWSRVKALLDRHHVDDIRVAVDGGSIVAPRGDGVRAHYATYNSGNGGIGVTVAAGATVGGGVSGVHAANAGTGLMVKRKYLSDWTAGDGETEVAAQYVSGPAGSRTTAALRDQLVTVGGTVTGGTDAAVRLAGGGGVLVLEGGKVHAGSSGEAVLVGPGPGLVYVGGEVRGGAGGSAAIRLTGGGSVTLGPNGKVSADGAARAIRGSDDADEPTAVTVAIGSALEYKEDVAERIAGSLEGVAEVVFRMYDRSGAPTGTATTLPVLGGGMPDVGGYPWRPVVPAPTVSALSCPATGRCVVTTGPGAVAAERTGVYAAVAEAGATGGAPAAGPVVDVTWTGTFAHAEGSDDDGRFTAANPVAAVAYDRTAAAGRTVRYGGAAGIEAQVLSWGDVVAQVARGDDPGEIADTAAQAAILAADGAASRRDAVLAQFRAALGNAEVDASAVIAAIDGDAATVAELGDDEILAYLGTDDVGIRVLLRNILAQGLSDGEKDVLRAAATGDGAALEAALAAAGFTDDAADDTDYWSRVRALPDRRNGGDIRIAVEGGSIASRGDGIRAYYATYNSGNGGIGVAVAAGATVEGAEAGVYAANAGGDIGVSVSGGVTGGMEGIRATNAGGDIGISVSGSGGVTGGTTGIRATDAGGGIDVTVAAGATVTGAEAGVRVADAGGSLMLAREYTPRWEGDGDGGDLVAAMHGGVPLPDQLVTVHGTVTGGTDAAVHLSGGGAVLVMEGGRVHAGASGVAVLVNDPGPALIHVDGEVRGGAGGAAAVHLTGGGSVVVRPNGRVEADGADYAVRGGGTPGTGVDVVLATDRAIEYRDEVGAAVAARVGGPLEPGTVIRLREERNGAPTGYRTDGLSVGEDGRPDVGVLDPRPEPVRPGPVRPDGGREPDGGRQPGDGRQPEPEPVMTLACRDAADGRCGLYEALPSMLAAMNVLPSHAERMSAARDARGGWASVGASRGEWRARKATTGGGLAYDHRRSVARAGMVGFAAGGNVLLGVSAHGLRGRAGMAGVGEVELTGVGAGVSATWTAGDFHLDAQAQATSYDVGVRSHTHGRLTGRDAGGAGYALGLDLGRRTALGGASVTPRAGISWSRVGLSDFTDMGLADGPRARVSVKPSGGAKARLGVAVEAEPGSGNPAGRLFGSLEVERAFSTGTTVRVGRDVLKAGARRTAVRLDLGWTFRASGNISMNAAAGYRTSGGGTGGYGGSLGLRMRF